MSLSHEPGNDTLMHLQEILAANSYATPQPQRKNLEARPNDNQSEEDPSSDTENCETQVDDTLDNITDGEGEGSENKSIYETNYSESQDLDEDELPKENEGEDQTEGPEAHKVVATDTVQSSNIAADFVVVSNDEVKQDTASDINEKGGDHDVDYGNEHGSCGGRRRRRRLESDGYTWSRQLVFRAKLTMHTAFERPDNVDPAAVTALAVSKDHRTIYVGDEKGRVFSWSVSSRPGKGKIEVLFIVTIQTPFF